MISISNFTKGHISIKKIGGFTVLVHFISSDDALYVY